MNEKTLVSAAITACVAQLVEQRIRNAQVAGSSPAASSIDPSDFSEGFLLFIYVQIEARLSWYTRPQTSVSEANRPKGGS